MSDWSEIADDHYVALSWSGGLNRDSDGYPLSPPSSDPSMSGGLDTYFSRLANAQMHRNTYRCKFCRNLIGFVNRKPLNLADGSPHRCLADAAAARKGGHHD